MPVMRVERNGNYTVMSNVHLDDKRLSLKAIGLLSKMLRLPPDWNYTVAGLEAICREGKDAITAAIRELEAAGYVVRQQTHDEAGQFSNNDYIVYEAPVCASPLAGFPSTVNPSTVNPSTDNPSQINTNKPSNIYTKPPIVPHGGRRRKKGAPMVATEHEPEMFDRFWRLYPAAGRKDKQAAMKAWDELKPDNGLMLKMSAALKMQLASEEWERGIGIPYACRWLSKRRWEDVEPVELPEMTGGGAVRSDLPCL